MIISRRLALGASALAAALLAITAVGMGQAAKRPGFKDTPMLPGGKWHVHDSDRPWPVVVTPGTASTPDRPGQAPSDAVVLFDGKDLSKWRNEKGGDANWDVKDGAIVSKKGTGTLVSRDEFGDSQIHVEFATPNPPKGNGQGRGNSGVLIFGRYEIQVLDSFENPTYADGGAAPCTASTRPWSTPRARPASGRPTTSSSPPPGSRPTARSRPRRTSPSCTTASPSTTTRPSTGRWPTATSSPTRPTAPRAPSSSRTTATPSGSATSGSAPQGRGPGVKLRPTTQSGQSALGSKLMTPTSGWLGTCGRRYGLSDALWHV